MMIPPKCNKCGSVIFCKDAVAVTRLRQHQASKECRALVMAKHLRDRDFMPLKHVPHPEELHRFESLGIEVVKAETRIFTAEAHVVQHGFKKQDNVEIEAWAPAWLVIVQTACFDLRVVEHSILRAVRDDSFRDAILTVYALAPESPIFERAFYKHRAVSEFLRENCA